MKLIPNISIRLLIQFILIGIYSVAVSNDTSGMITQNVARQIEDINKSRQKIEERINLRHSFLESHLKTLSSINVARYRMNTKQLFDSFEQVQSIWQELVKRSFSSISSQFLQDDLPNIKSQILFGTCVRRR